MAVVLDDDNEEVMKFENIRVLVNDEWSGVMHAEWVTDGGAGGI